MAHQPRPSRGSDQLVAALRRPAELDDLTRRQAAVAALRDATVLVPLEPGSDRRVTIYEGPEGAVLPIFSDDDAYRRFRPAGGQCAEMTGDAAIRLATDHKLRGLLLDGAGPAPLALPLNELILGVNARKLPKGAQVSAIPQPWVGAPRGRPDAGFVDAARPICREFGVEHAYLFETSRSPDGPRQLTLGVVLPTNERPSGEEARRLVQLASRMSPILQSRNIDLAFLDGDETQILDAGVDILAAGI